MGPQGLRVLKIMVFVLTGTMIVGLVTIVSLLVIRLPGSLPAAPLPDEITLPGGERPVAFTATARWYAVVTAGDEILIYDRATGELRQRIAVTSE